MRNFLIVCFFIFFSMSAHAKGVSPYLPLKLDPIVELEIERLVSVTGLPTLIKPYQIVTVNRYLQQVKHTHPMLYSRLHTYIKRYKKQKAVTHFSAEISEDFGDSDAFALHNKRGQNSSDNYRFSFASFYQYNSYLIVNSGGSFFQGSAVPHNTFVSLGWDELQLDFGYREHWLAPHHDSSLLLSTQAEPPLTLTLSNVTPFTDWQLKYEMSFGLLNSVDNILFEQERYSGKPGFLTMHLSVQLFDWWTLGGNRTMMFGGGKRSIAFKDVWNAVIDPVNSDNCGGDGTSLQDCDQEVGNQIASITSRFDFSLGDFPVSLFIDYGGEDTKDFNKTSFGNIGRNFGVFLPYLTESMSLNLEWAKFHRLWYIHHIYGEGYTNKHNVMGHWWGDGKTQGDPSSGEAISTKLTWDDREKLSVIVQYRSQQINIEAGSLKSYERSHQLDLTFNYLFDDAFVGLTVSGGKDNFGDNFIRTSLSYMW
ncbi:capsule assembly Wzi family protein [Thalassotalea sp. 1_MG-2023]|nr:capsule assembly Wzi family protein [Thalassotalea sp. 1_MG-2023]